MFPPQMLFSFNLLLTHKQEDITYALKKQVYCMTLSRLHKNTAHKSKAPGSVAVFPPQTLFISNFAPHTQLKNSTCYCKK